MVERQAAQAGERLGGVGVAVLGHEPARGLREHEHAEALGCVSFDAAFAVRTISGLPKSETRRTEWPKECGKNRCRSCPWFRS